MHDPDGRYFYFRPSMTTMLFAGKAVGKSSKVIASALWKRPGMGRFARMHAKLRHEKEVQERDRRAKERTAQSLVANLNRMQSSRKNPAPASSIAIPSWDIAQRLLSKGSELSESARAEFQKHLDCHEPKGAEAVAKLPPPLLHYREDLRDVGTREEEMGAFVGHFAQALEDLPPEMDNLAGLVSGIPEPSDRSLSQMTFVEMRDDYKVEGHEGDCSDAGDNGNGGDRGWAKGPAYDEFLQRSDNAGGGREDHLGKGSILEREENETPQNVQTVHLSILPRMPAMGNVRPVPVQAQSKKEKGAPETGKAAPSPSHWLSGDRARVNLAPTRFPLVLTSTTLCDAERHVYNILQSPSPRKRANLLEPVKRSGGGNSLETDMGALKRTLFPGGGFQLGR